jgi:hypothetical protein
VEAGHKHVHTHVKLLAIDQERLVDVDGDNSLFPILQLVLTLDHPDTLATA